MEYTYDLYIYKYFFFQEENKDNVKIFKRSEQSVDNDIQPFHFTAIMKYRCFA